MKENTSDILAELEQALLDEEEAETLAEEMEAADTEALLTEPVRGDEMVYRNFSNRYGADLRNFASGYCARNTDKVDVDLEEFSEAVAEEEKASRLWLPLLIMVAAAAVVAYMIAVVLGGIL